MNPIQMSQFQIVARPHPRQRGYLFELVKFWTDSAGYQMREAVAQYVPSTHSVVPFVKNIYGQRVYQ